MSAITLTAFDAQILEAVIAEETSSAGTNGGRLGGLTPWINQRVTGVRKAPKVRQRLNAMLRFGLLECDRRTYKCTLRWLITDEGRAVLAFQKGGPQ